ncbi:hypothetical protein CE91St44_34390 [Oscillospiraceae bacterium]|nr:hypothetical protein CE91St44_34390 [Oscillospiraceae bacterium]
MAEEDLIFGKNRHFFGGIEPSNMQNFTAVIEGEHVKITAQLPADTVINGQTLCTVEGAVIRRKTTDYPKDEFDGEEVAVIKTSTTFVDSSTSATGTYYYAAFPFTTQGVYNRNKVNRVVVNEPEPMEEFSAKSVYVSSSDTVKVEITAKLPDGVAGAVIRKSTTGYPTSETDGDALTTIMTDTVYTDTNVTVGTTYYYSAFPYTSTGAYNRSEANRTSVTPKKRDYLFGYDLVKSTSSPSGRVSYPDDVDNADFTPAKMNFGGSFSYGDWNFAPGEKFMPRPCMLTFAGVVDHYLNPNDYTQKAEGGASKVADTSFGGNAMMEWPKIYTKRWEEGGVYHFRCSDTPQDESWECWSNYDRLNNQIDHFYTPIYFGSNVSSKLRSISGQANMVNQNATTEINYAKANGSDWYTEVLADRLLIQDLLVMMGKSTDGQTVYGKGRCDTNSAVNTGTMNSRGMFWGSNNGTDGVKVFGMEHFWGNLWRRTAGWMNVNGTQKVKLTRGTKDGSTVSDYNTDGNGYKTVSGATPSGSSGGYINSMKTEGFGRIPVTASGSSSTFEADGLYYNNSGTMYAFVGGYWSRDLPCGPFCATLASAPSTSDSGSGAALSCKPLATA